MASTAVPEASEIRRRGRRRLIGAVVMVALLVVFVPMVLDSDPRPPHPGPTAAIPSKEDAPQLPPPTKLAAPAVQPAAEAKPAEAPKAAQAKAPETKSADAPKAAETRPAAAPVTATAEPAKVTAVESAKVDSAEPPKVAAAEPPNPSDSNSPAPSKVTEAAVLKGFAVQVGAFRDEAKLEQAREKLVAAGVVHYLERLESKGGPLTRLRAGPFATREEAEAALVKVKRNALEGKVVPLP